MKDHKAHRARKAAGVIKVQPACKAQQATRWGRRGQPARLVRKDHPAGREPKDCQAIKDQLAQGALKGQLAPRA